MAIGLEQGRDPRLLPAEVRREDPLLADHQRLQSGRMGDAVRRSCCSGTAFVAVTLRRWRRRGPHPPPSDARRAADRRRRAAPWSASSIASCASSTSDARRYSIWIGCRRWRRCFVGWPLFRRAAAPSRARRRRAAARAAEARGHGGDQGSRVRPRAWASSRTRTSRQITQRYRDQALAAMAALDTAATQPRGGRARCGWRSARSAGQAAAARQLLRRLRPGAARHKPPESRTGRYASTTLGLARARYDRSAPRLQPARVRARVQVVVVGDLPHVIVEVPAVGVQRGRRSPPGAPA